MHAQDVEFARQVFIQLAQSVFQIVVHLVFLVLDLGQDTEGHFVLGYGGVVITQDGEFST